MKAHIIGLAGSGKSTLAARLGDARDAPVHDLDSVVYDGSGERSAAARDAEINDIRRAASWITEGAYHEAWLEPLLDDADPIIWLDVPVWRCLWRILRRHAVAELSRSNRHPGWGKLWRFLRYTQRTASSQRHGTIRLLHDHQPKVRRCRLTGEIEALKRQLMETHRAA